MVKISYSINTDDLFCKPSENKNTETEKNLLLLFLLKKNLILERVDLGLDPTGLHIGNNKIIIFYKLPLFYVQHL